MLTDSEKRVLFQAVSRHVRGEPDLTRQFLAALKDSSHGSVADLLDTLVRCHLLSKTLAGEVQQLLRPATPEKAKGVGPGVSSALPYRPAQVLAPTMLDVSHAQTTTLDEDDTAGGGRTIGNCQLLRKIGQGGMCTVYLGYQEAEHRKVAVKILPAKMAASQNHVDRFYREARSGALLNHPNIVKSYGYGQDPATRQHYLVLEYVDGPSVLDLIVQYGRLSVADAVHVILDIARGLEHAHSRNVIHRDIKPDNILVTVTGVAKLADMGLAKRTDEPSHLTGTHQGFGTPYYMPYEQAMNAKTVDGRADIYALGATLYHMVTGEVPFAGESPMEILDRKGSGDFTPASYLNTSVPPVLDEALEMMLARQPEDRFQTVSELIVELERSRLAADVLSFVDAGLAYQDPVVRQRLKGVAQPTCLDLARKGPAAVGGRTNPDVWYLRYRVRKKQWCKTRATTAQVLRRLREKKLGAETQASHRIDGEYHPLGAYQEFQSAVRSLERKRRQTATLSESRVLEEFVATRSRERWAWRLRVHLARFWLAYGTAAVAFLGGLLYALVRLGAAS